MLRGNLSSRPFYSEGLVTTALLLVAVAVAALTAYNVARLTALSAERAELDRAIARDQGEALRIRADIRAAVAGVDMGSLEALVADASEANGLIAHRTFSWTEFLRTVEGALPYEVRLVGVTHRAEEGERLLVMNLVAQADEQLNEFVQAMLETGVFFDVLPVEKARNDDGTVSAIVQTYYLSAASSGGSQPPSVAGDGRGGR